MSNVDNVAAVFSEEGGEPKPIEGVYGPIAPGARLTYAWASPLTQIVIYVLSVVPAVIVAAIVAVPLIMANVDAVQEDGTFPPDVQLLMVAIAAIVQFPVWALLIIGWVRGFERRTLASAGFCGPFALRKYAIGLAIGVAVALALAVLSPVVAPEMATEVGDFDLSRVMQGKWLLMIAGLLAFFLVQGAAEEIACRGWMLSAVAARRGIIAGIVGNSVVFAALHLQVFRDDAIEFGMIGLCVLVVVTLTGWLGRRGLIGGLVVSAGLLAITPWSLSPADAAYGMLAMTAVGCVGLFFSFLAVSQRSIAGACGAHGAFNATIMIATITAIAATSPDARPQDVLMETLMEATGQGSEVSFGGAGLQLVLFAGLSFLIWRWLAQRRPEFR